MRTKLLLIINLIFLASCATNMTEGVETSIDNANIESESKVLDTDKEWILYHNCFSLCSRKVRVCLKELDITADLKHIEIIETKDCENLEKKFLKINPQATVPVLLHHGKPIYESHEQIAFLEKYNPILK